ncbi:YigZ family protein [bacterium]|nr:YigZ family protein [bacterium]
MLNLKEKFNTVEKPAFAKYTEKNSKFLGFVFPLKTKQKLDKVMDVLKTKYQGATHYVYAYRIGVTSPEDVFRDAGEPVGTAGIPLLNVLKKYDLTNTAIIVIRYYGGKKLGKTGLKETYSTVADMAVQNANIVERIAEKHITIIIPYALGDSLTNIINAEYGRILEKEYSHNVLIKAAIFKYKYSEFTEKMAAIDEVVIVDNE